MPFPPALRWFVGPVALLVWLVVVMLVPFRWLWLRWSLRKVRAAGLLNNYGLPPLVAFGVGGMSSLNQNGFCYLGGEIKPRFFKGHGG